MSTPHRPKLFLLLLGVLALEFLMAAALTVLLLIELVVDRPDSLPTAIALLVLAAIATAWIGATLLGTVRGQAWIRGSAIVWQVLQFAVGLGAVQGTFAPSAAVWGWPLIAVSVIGFMLLFAPTVVAVTSDRRDVED